MADLDGVALVTAAYVVWVYLLMPLGPIGKMTEQVKGQQNWGDRSFMNSIEQAPLFLASLWTHAYFVSGSAATNLGIAYLVCRVGYVVIWAMKGTEGFPMPAGFIFTFPAYGFNIYMMIGTITKLGFGMIATPMIDAVGAILCSALFFMYAVKVTPVIHQAVKPMFTASSSPQL
eukprot:CAMPEP_0183360760 /NCGR_PEP_ID=MMETSP0164_2-20130417/56055_1 /TAXON_ID=221442 /ORGANISM="Coccolithus pelagicus ssp braarudi, Strain PLY182g" /LENGTH=173 /DNA_ID=CAMNT_0025535187 /DNA_START=25 /DNA_END=546 /DNA_ORIENTATION=-